MSTNNQIKSKDRATIIQALRAGVTPRSGLNHIQVGRSKELTQLNKDIDLITEGGSTIRFIIGDYGAGKTFFFKPYSPDSFGEAVTSGDC
ncbi:BREX system ATP-binding domain-containing protein [Acinetobacter sp.]|uniref:BREX system ATP-binding domain-containing protein n=1 Tax=Acinetobacter sp. TaxID=472 RepID=UPI0025BCE6B2|nr:BREX system ATP-binding domain-containing protein [Acinetobacter sp.]